MFSTVPVWRRIGWLTAVSLFTALFASLAFGQALYAADETETLPVDGESDVASLLAADLSDSAKMVNLGQAVSGQTLAYTIVLSNSGDTFANVSLTDTLPIELMIVADSISINGASGNPLSGVMGQVITFSNLVIFANDPVSITYQAVVSDSVMVGDSLTNTAVFLDELNTSMTYTRTAVTEIISGTADFSGSTKTVDETMPRAGEVVNYTVVVSNAGNLAVDMVELVDSLPTGLSLTGTPNSSAGGTFDTSNPQQLLWTGTVGEDTAVSITYQARVGQNVADYTVLTNSVTINSDFTDTITRTATIEVEPSDYSAYLPYIAKPVPLPTTLTDFTSTRPNSNNSWTLSWTATNASSYEIQESQDPNFGDVVTYQTSDQSYNITKNASYRNVYYYRARAILGNNASDWSAPIQVIGGYYDNFENPDSGWALRRTTLIEGVNGLYEGPPAQTDHWFVMWISDKWDWGIASPLMPAPSLPYVIEFRSTVINAGNLTSGGPVFAGDWNGDPNGCIDYSTLQTVYEHTDCFNQFYFANNIWTGGFIKTQWERVDQLAWCPECGNSPMKRGRFDWSPHPVFNIIPTALQFDDWHDYRIEVRENEIKYFVDGELKFTDTDVRHVTTNPYFGVAATTDEYQPSIQRYRYYSVMPLDN